MLIQFGQIKYVFALWANSASSRKRYKIIYIYIYIYTHMMDLYFSLSITQWRTWVKCSGKEGVDYEIPPNHKKIKNNTVSKMVLYLLKNLPFFYKLLSFKLYNKINVSFFRHRKQTSNFINIFVNIKQNLIDLPFLAHIWSQPSF